MPKISVIIPVYNVEKYLGECLDSILGQTLSDIEVLCVDDGSTDGSAGIIAEYAARDKRVVPLSTPHVGAYKARREGLSRATGEYIYFMDSDDAIDVNAFAELVAMGDRDNLDEIVFAAEVFFDDDPDVIQRFRRSFLRTYTPKPEVCGRVMFGPELFRKLVMAGCYYPGPPLRLIRRCVLEVDNYGFPDAPFHCDNYFTTVSLYNSRRAVAVNRKYYRRRVRPGSITTSAGTERIHCRSILNVIKGLLEFKPFRQDILDGEPAASRNLSKLVRNLVRRSRKFGNTDIHELFRETSEGSGASVFILIHAVCRPTFIALDERPYSVLGCLKYVFGRLLGLRAKIYDFLAG